MLHTYIIPVVNLYYSLRSTWRLCFGIDHLLNFLYGIWHTAYGTKEYVDGCAILDSLQDRCEYGSGGDIYNILYIIRNV